MYDPQTGRFTQEDPIGLAGGVNAYGFGNGDPVNFGDPFGLFGCKGRGDPTCSGEAASPGFFDPIAFLAGGIVGGIRSLFARATVRAAVADAAATGSAAAAEAGAAQASGATISSFATKAAAREALGGMGLTQAQAAAAGSAISRATSTTSIEFIQREGGELLVHLVRPGRNGFQVVQSVISPNGLKSVTQYGIDRVGRVVVDPKFP